jgi:hypothetical protein
MSERIISVRFLLTGRREIRAMEYQREARLFLERSKEEVRRLEAQIRQLADIIVRIEALVRTPPESGVLKEEEPALVSSPDVVSSSTLPPSFSPADKPPAMDPSPMVRPVGEVAEEILKIRGEPVSLDDLYRTMKDRPDLSPSSDLKNAIRVSLVRRRPRILSERRGWFQYVKES